MSWGSKLNVKGDIAWDYNNGAYFTLLEWSHTLILQRQINKCWCLMEVWQESSSTAKQNGLERGRGIDNRTYSTIVKLETKIHFLFGVDCFLTSNECATYIVWWSWLRKTQGWHQREKDKYHPNCHRAESQKLLALIPRVNEGRVTIKYIDYTVIYISSVTR
jgi:hypothetical protein